MTRALRGQVTISELWWTTNCDTHQAPLRLHLMTARVSILDVAAAAGVSKSTASRALLAQPGVTDEVKATVIRAAETLGYVKDYRAHALKSTSTKTVGIIVRTVRLDFYAELIAAIQTQLEANGYRVAFTGAGESGEGRNKALNGLLGLRPEAVIVASGRIPMKAIEAVGTQVPTTVIGPSTTSTIVGSVADDGHGITSLAKLVSGAGHERVGVVTFPRNRSTTLSLRAQRLRRELAVLGITAIPVACDPTEDSADTDSLRSALPQITALMCPNDPTMVSTWAKLDSWGVRVPEDLALTGYDGIGQIANPLFGLTTWQQDIAGMANAAATNVLERITQPDRAVQHARLRGQLLRGRTL